MREWIKGAEIEAVTSKYKNNPECCFVFLDGREITTRDEYYKALEKQLQLNETFSNNYSAYCDMMCDPYTYYNKQCIVFVIDFYEQFLRGDVSKEMIEEIFDESIMPFFDEDIKGVMDNETNHEIHVYCVIRL